MNGSVTARIKLGEKRKPGDLANGSLREANKGGRWEATGSGREENTLDWEEITKEGASFFVLFWGGQGGRSSLPLWRALLHAPLLLLTRRLRHNAAAIGESGNKLQ